MMGIQTLIDNKDAIPQILRQAGYLTMANQVEDDLTGLAEELTKCQHERADALLALRTIQKTMEKPHGYHLPVLGAARERSILAIAKKALEANE